MIFIRNKWTDEELQFIRDNYNTMSDLELSKYFGNHTEGSVATKRKRMKLNRPKWKYTFNDVLEEFAKNPNMECLAQESDYKDTATNSLPYICKKHKDKGIQTTSLSRLQSGRGCFYCGRERTGMAHRVDENINTQECINLCAEKGFIYKGWHKENGLIYIDYICTDHPLAGIQKMRKGNMARKNIIGCPYCLDKKKYKFSKGEKQIENFLMFHNIEYIPQFTFKDCKDKTYLPFDFYLPKLNMIIEYDGQHHFYPVTFNGVSEEQAQINHNATKYHDTLKDNYCINNGIEIIRIPYYDFKNIEQILEEKLIS